MRWTAFAAVRALETEEVLRVGSCEQREEHFAQEILEGVAEFPADLEAAILRLDVPAGRRMAVHEFSEDVHGAAEDFLGQEVLVDTDELGAV